MCLLLRIYSTSTPPKPLIQKCDILLVWKCVSGIIYILHSMVIHIDLESGWTYWIGMLGLIYCLFLDIPDTFLHYVILEVCDDTFCMIFFGLLMWWLVRWHCQRSVYYWHGNSWSLLNVLWIIPQRVFGLYCMLINMIFMEINLGYMRVMANKDRCCLVNDFKTISFDCAVNTVVYELSWSTKLNVLI